MDMDHLLPLTRILAHDGPGSDTCQSVPRPSPSLLYCPPPFARPQWSVRSCTGTRFILFSPFPDNRSRIPSTPSSLKGPLASSEPPGSVLPSSSACSRVAATITYLPPHPHLASRSSPSHPDSLSLLHPPISLLYTSTGKLAEVSVPSQSIHIFRFSHWHLGAIPSTPT